MMQLLLDDIDLSADPKLAGEQMEWVDEWEWNAVEQDQRFSLAGVPIIQEGAKVHGRPITLSSNGGAWFTLATIRALQVKAALPGAMHLLTLPTGEQHYVAWNRVAGPVVQAVPVERRVNPGPDWLYQLTLRFITVAPPPAPPTPDPEP